MSTPRAHTALRRNILIAASAFGLALIVVVAADRRDAARTSRAEQQAKFAAVQQRMREVWTDDSSPYPSPVHAPAVESPAAKPVVLAVVKPWIEIARMPQYVHASAAERTAIRNLYWRVCVEEKVPSAQRVSAYQQFLRNTSESDVLEALQQAPAPSPVSAEAMRRACHS